MAEVDRTGGTLQNFGLRIPHREGNCIAVATAKERGGGAGRHASRGGTGGRRPARRRWNPSELRPSHLDTWVEATLLWWPGGVGVDGCVRVTRVNAPQNVFVWHQWLALPLFSKVFSFLPVLLEYFNKDNDNNGRRRRQSLRTAIWR